MATVREQYNEACRLIRLDKSVDLFRGYENYRPEWARVWNDKTNEGLDKFNANMIYIANHEHDLKEHHNIYPRYIAIAAVQSVIGGLLGDHGSRLDILALRNRIRGKMSEALRKRLAVGKYELQTIESLRGYYRSINWNYPRKPRTYYNY